MTKPITFQISNAVSEVANSLPIAADFDVAYEDATFYILSAGEKVKLVDGLIFKHTDFILKIKTTKETQPEKVEPNLYSQFLFTEEKNPTDLENDSVPIAALNHPESHHEITTLFSHAHSTTETELSFLFGNQPTQTKIRAPDQNNSDIMLHGHDLNALLNQHFTAPQHAVFSIVEDFSGEKLPRDEENILYDLGFDSAKGARHSKQMQLNSLQTHNKNFIFGYLEDTRSTLPTPPKDEEASKLPVSTWLKRLFSFN